MESVQDYEVCEVCHFAAECKKCCRKCEKCNTGSQQICGLADPMRIRVERVKWLKEWRAGMAKPSKNAGMQKELPGMPTRSKLGDKVIEYLHVKDERDAVKNKIDTIKKELIELFLAEGKTSLKVEHKVVSVSPKDGYKITVKVAT